MNLQELKRKNPSDLLKYAEELSVAQIARVLRKTQTHVKVLLFRARLTLGRALEHTPLHALTTHQPAAPTHHAACFPEEVSRL